MFAARIKGPVPTIYSHIRYNICILFMSTSTRDKHAQKERRDIEKRMSLKAAGYAVQMAFAKKGEKISAEHTVVVKDSKGKPYISVGGFVRKDVQISLSHSYPYALAVSRAGRGVVGCDVERVRDFVPTTTDAFLTAKEKGTLARYSSRTRKIKITLAWSYKESILKALGTGLRTHPSRVDVSPLLGKRERVRIGVTLGSKKHIFQAWSERLQGGYVATVVAEII